MSRFSTLLLVLLTFLAPLAAQTPDAANAPAPPGAAALGNLAERLANTGPADAVAGTATRFKPTGQRLTLDAFVTNLGKTADERAGLRQVLQAVLTGYEAEATKGGFANDVAAALAFYLVAHYTAYHDGAEVGDPAQNALVAQLRGALNTEAMRGTADEDKQRLYEFLVLMGGFTATMRQLGIDQKDAALQKTAHQLGANGLKAVLNVEASRVGITTTGLTIAPEPAAATSPATSAIRLTDISYTVPVGWTEQKPGGSIILTVKGGDAAEPRDCSLVLTPGLAKTGSLPNSLESYWHDVVLSNFDGPSKPFPFVCQLRSGLNCAFGLDDMKKRTTGGGYCLAAYAIDAGNEIVGVTVIYSASKLSVSADKLWTTPIEGFFDSLKIRGAPTGKPIATRADLAGKWADASTSIASYVTAAGNYAGDASIATSENYVFGADGTFTHYLFAMTGGTRVRENQAGTYRLDGDVLVMTEKGGRVVKQQFLGRGPTDDGKGTLIYLRPANDVRPVIGGNFYKQGLVLTPP